MRAGHGHVGRRRRRLRWTWIWLLGMALLGSGIGIAVHLSHRKAPHRPGEAVDGLTEILARGIPASAPRPQFTEVARQAGLHFQQFSGPRSSQLPEDMGSGAAWGDFDNDGDEDLFLVSSGGGLDRPVDERARSELYENRGDGTFKRVADFQDLRIIGMGAAWADYDGDGWLDLVVSGYGVLALFHNDSGRLVRRSGLGSPEGFWAGVSWGDYDRDGDPDLYVCGYVRYEPLKGTRGRPVSQYGQSVPRTLNPSAYEPERNLLFRNDGAGRFTEVGASLGVDDPSGRSLGGLWHDFDGNGWIDLYVANDVSDNAFFVNSEGHFHEVSDAAWVADYRGAMGLAVGDRDGDGDDDLFISHWLAQENALYDSLLAQTTGGAGGAASSSPVHFVDVADQVGLGQIALPMVGWGTDFADLDADGWLDLLVANGSTLEDDHPLPQLKPQRLFLFWNEAGTAFHDLAPLDDGLARLHVSRGLAVCDYDQDGDLDFVVVDHGEGVRLFRNEMQAGNWVEIRLKERTASGSRLGGEALGATVVASIGGRLVRRTVSGVSYLSQSSRLIHLGLGASSRVDGLQVVWPDGSKERYPGIPANSAWIVEQGGQPRRVPQAKGVGALPSRRRHPGEFWEIQRAGIRAMKVEGDLPQAVRLFQEALALDPEHEDTLYALGLCLARQGQIPAALKQFAHLVKVNPMSHRGLRQWALLRAESARSRKDLLESEQWLEKALDLNPEETGVLQILGEVHLMLGEPGLARQRLRWICRTNSGAVGGQFLLAYLAWRQGDESTTRERLEAAVRGRGEAWKPPGTTAEGDLKARSRTGATLLSEYWRLWDGAPDDPDRVFAPLHAFLQKVQALP